MPSIATSFRFLLLALFIGIAIMVLFDVLFFLFGVEFSFIFNISKILRKKKEDKYNKKLKDFERKS